MDSVKKFSEYKIPLRGLKVGNYYYDFKLDDAFFQSIEGSEIQHGDVDVEANVERHNNLMLIKFHLEGEVEVVCDRCLDLFNIPVISDNDLSIRFSTLLSDESFSYEEVEGVEDVLFANPNDDFLDISHYLYESVCLSLPIQRVHTEDENGESLCDNEVIKYLKKNK